MDVGYVTHYRDIHRRTARGMARHGALTLLAAGQRLRGGLASLAGWHRVQFFCVHHVFEDERASFARLIERLSRTHRFISYDEAVRRILEGRVDGPYLVLSFDDGFRSCVEAGRIMRDEGVRGMFFVCGSTIGGSGEIPPERIAAHCRERLNLPPVEHMAWDDLETLRNWGHEIGGHTMTHPNLAEIPMERVRDEVGRVRAVLIERLGECRHFAWTYGRFREFSAQAARAVFDAGYDSCASGERGVHVNTQAVEDPRLVCLRRDHLIAAWPYEHVRYFMARNRERIVTPDTMWPAGWAKEIRGVDGERVVSKASASV
jgi:peptidoglycan/xylan/chitin deacetylase (PgdA/CDA1 family)